MKKKKPFLISVSSLLLMFLFQNCQGYHDKLESEADIASFNANAELLNKKAIWSMNKMHVTSKDSIYYVNPQLFSGQSVYDWYFLLDGKSSGCSVLPHEDFKNAVKINCSSEGELEVKLSIIDENFSIQELEFESLIENMSDFNPAPSDAEIYLAESEVIVGLDGNLGGGGDSSDSSNDKEPQVGEVSGAQLYAQHCASCHSPLSNSNKKGRSFGQIKGAISSIGAMLSLSGLSDEEIQKIADAL